MPSESPRIYVMLKPVEHDRVLALSEEMNISKSALIQHIVRDWLVGTVKQQMHINRRVLEAERGAYREKNERKKQARAKKREKLPVIFPKERGKA